MRHGVEFSSLFFGIILIPYLLIVNDFTLFVFMLFPAFTLVSMFYYVTSDVSNTVPYDATSDA